MFFVLAAHSTIVSLLILLASCQKPGCLAPIAQSHFHWFDSSFQRSPSRLRSAEVKLHSVGSRKPRGRSLSNPVEYTAHTIKGLQRLSWLRSQFIFSRLIRRRWGVRSRSLQEQRCKVEVKLAGWDLRHLRGDLCLWSNRPDGEAAGGMAKVG